MSEETNKRKRRDRKKVARSGADWARTDFLHRPQNWKAIEQEARGV